MTLTDTHAHLYSTEYDEDRTAMVQRSIEAGVTRLFMPNIDRASALPMFLLQKQFPENCYSMLGLHPCSIGEDYEQELEWLEQILLDASSQIVAIGEIGLDFYHDKTFAHQQEIAFRKQIEMAISYHLPLILHVRKAFEQTIKVLEEYKSHHLKGIFHCYSGSLDQALEALEVGDFKFGIGGVVTFKNSALQHVVASLSLDHIVLETDAPFLAPMPFRGQRNESAYLTYIAQKVADLNKCTLEEVAQITTKNSKDIFGV